MDRLQAGADAAAGAFLAAITVVLCETVLWAGQPARGAKGPEILAFYDSNQHAIAIGDLIWLAGMLALGIAAWLVAERLGGVPSIVVGLLASIAVLLEIASAVTGFALSNGASTGNVDPAQGLATWQLQTHLYQAGALVLGLVLVAVSAVLLRRSGPRGGVLAAAAVLVILGGTALGHLDLAFPAAIAWLGVVGATQD